MDNTMPTPTWKYFPNGKDAACELTEKEEWCWVAHYTDGTTLKQFDDEGFFHYFAEIDQSKIGVFSMEHNLHPPINIVWRPGLKLIHFHKVTVFTRQDESPEMRIRIPCFGYEGWSETKQDVIKVIFVVMPDFSIVVTDDVNKIDFFGGANA
jgi:hypothetical protein